MTSFIFIDDREMMVAQRHFIDLGVHTLAHADFAHDLLKENYYKIITLILQRGELDLAQMAVGFHENYKKESVRKQVKKDEIDIIIKY